VLAMRELREQGTSAARRHIIERPRLTRRLDEASARVITLIAPAGYGKTTLARQWLAGRPHAWLQANEASSDVVALAIDLANVLTPLGSGTNEQVITRVRTIRDLGQELRPLAELQARELGSSPDGAWLVIDDYEHIARSEVAEEYVRLLLQTLGIRFLVASRVSPAWATPRALLYGDINAIDREELAMRQAEARAVLRGAPESHISEILELADGWPALVGLASLASLDDMSIGDLPRPLFDYFADELFHRCSRPLRLALPQLALAPRVTSALVGFLIGPRKGPRLLEEATDVGFFSSTASDLRLHPLLRRFLLTKLNNEPGTRAVVARRLFEFFLLRHDWNDAFELIREQRDAAALVKLCDAGYADMLSSGRTTTLESWLNVASQLAIVSPLFDLIRAELALRNRSLAHAERLALNIINEEDAEPYRSRALTVAGRAAHLDNRESDALEFFQAAAETAQNDDERHEATWGSLLSAQAMLTHEDVLATLAEFLAREPGNADDVLRASNARLIVAITIGNVAEAIEFAQDALDALDHAQDPVIRTSFLNNLSRSLSFQARYLEGQEFADRLIADAQGARLDFVLPHAYLAEAVALSGMQEFVQAKMMVKQVEQLARQMDDLHNVLDARNVRARIAISLRDYDQALRLTTDLRGAASVSTAMSAELVAARGLAQACAGAVEEADRSLDKGEGLSTLPEVRSLIACARAVSSLRRTGKVREAAVELGPAFELGILDPVVMICRACPEFVEPVSQHRTLPVVILDDLCRRPTDGISVGQHSQLTKRELEVLELISLGYTNREIAQELVIAEVTAKVHVRNVIRKLGVRSRTEAAIAAVRDSVSRTGAP
jgi:LuxR family transcriptional regulator, maltose regulon positive regulatory protein